MVLNEKHTTVAYRCPFCGSGVMSAVGLFGLSADMVRLKCPCGKSEMQIVRQRDSAADGTVRLTVPCLLCPKPHTFTLRDTVFFSDDLFTLPCPYSDVNICFTGEINRVKAELARTELELLDMLEQNGISDFSALHGDERDLGDPQVRDIVLYVIRELEAEGKLYCRCPDRQEPAADAGQPEDADLPDTGLPDSASPDSAPSDGDDRYEAEITPDGIRVTCRRCGATVLVPTGSMVSAHEFLTADSLRLK